ncbi:hypothetical protein SAMN05192539_106522 [Paraburkholderia diazotrophica]|uniref:Uncharacterized protein n=1 Tax=Paraburkholderia diazotrophica TaxID=667676 RepID=A0A1H7ENQ0_9BURK|nr:hypothetical protein SAMN05192539_106522 [Paraburkholderia diazotrophica]
MIKSEVYRFSYTLTRGLGRTYEVTINVARLDSGAFAYAGVGAL